MRFVAEEDLLHFGVKGMRWGHRKAANSKPVDPFKRKDRKTLDKAVKKSHK